MTRLLTPDQVTAYERDGFVFPVDVLTPAEVSAFRGELEAWERQRGAPIDFPEKSKPTCCSTGPTGWCTTRRCWTRRRT